MSTDTTTVHPEYAGWTPVDTQEVLDAILAERHRQVRKYGLNRNLVAGTGPETYWLAPNDYTTATVVEGNFRAEYEEFEAQTGAPTWMHLIREEVAEAFAEDDPTRLEAELIQVAALCVSMVERLRAGDL